MDRAIYIPGATDLLLCQGTKIILKAKGKKLYKASRDASSDCNGGTCAAHSMEDHPENYELASSLFSLRSSPYSCTFHSSISVF